MIVGSFSHDPRSGLAGVLAAVVGLKFCAHSHEYVIYFLARIWFS
jgi:hypothetical protein